MKGQFSPNVTHLCFKMCSSELWLIVQYVTHTVNLMFLGSKCTGFPSCFCAFVKRVHRKHKTRSCNCKSKEPAQNSLLFYQCQKKAENKHFKTLQFSAPAPSETCFSKIFLTTNTTCDCLFCFAKDIHCKMQQRWLVLAPSRGVQVSRGQDEAWDQQMDLCSSHGEEVAEPKGKAFDLLVNLHSYPHLTERTRSWIQAFEISFLYRGSSLSDRMRSME